MATVHSTASTRRTRRNDVTPIAPKPVLELDLADEPINIIDERLGHARATLDLLLRFFNGCDRQALDLRDDTLDFVLYGAMERIDEARKAANVLNDRYWELKRSNGDRQSKGRRS
jgi:hypothetical protein